MKSFILNPFFYYVCTCSIVVLLYSLSFSDLFVNTNFDLQFMFIATLFMAVACGFLFKHMLKRKLSKKINYLSTNNVLCICTFLIFGNLVEFFYTKTIPLLSIIKGVPYLYESYGIPTFHVLLLTYSSAFAITCFDRFLEYKNKVYLFAVFIVLLSFVLIVNRGAVILVTTSLAIMYVYKYFSFKLLVKLLFTVFVCGYLFGVMGNYRMKSSGYDSENAILEIGQANQNFESSDIPKEFFWVYIYATSPLANLSNQFYLENRNKGNFADLIALDFTPDFISKHMNINADDFKSELVTPELNVSTTFARPYIIMGTVGFCLMFIFFSFNMLLFILLSHRCYVVSVSSILCTITVFLMFTNMMVFAGIILQIYFILLLSRLNLAHGKFRFI